MSTLLQMYVHLKNSTQILEDEVRCSFNEIEKTIKSIDRKSELMDETLIHYGKIFEHLEGIKNHLQSMTEHSESVQILTQRPKSQIDKSYIRKQVEAFQKGTEDVHKREHKTKRPSYLVSSNISLESWNKYLDQKELQEEEIVVEVPKRKDKDIGRRKKKGISSTVYMIDEEEDFHLPSTLEELEEFNAENDKPIIVDFLYKKVPEA